MDYIQYPQSEKYIEDYTKDTYYPEISPSYPQNLTASELKLKSLEYRIETLEKMIHFHSDLIKLKEEEKSNDFTLKFNEMLSGVNSKIFLLESKIDQLIKEKNNQYSELTDKINELNKKIEKYEKEEISFSKKEKDITNLLADKLSEFDALIHKNELMIESTLKDHLDAITLQNDAKIQDLLGILEDLKNGMQDNEFEINEFKENMRNMQKENVDMIKVVALQEEKIKQIDFINQQIKNLKGKYLAFEKMNMQKEDEEDYIVNYLMKDNKEI